MNNGITVNEKMEKCKRTDKKGNGNKEMGMFHDDNGADQEPTPMR